MSDIPKTPDDAMIKSWIASLELLRMATEAAVSYQDHLDHLDGIEPDDTQTPDELHLQRIREAKSTLQALLHE